MGGNCIMRRTVLFTGLFCLLAMSRAWAEEPLVGAWQLIYQKVGDMKDMPKPLPAMKITQSGTALHFAYLEGLEGRVFMSFTVYLDGSEADIQNDKGGKIGTARLTKKGKEYTLVLQSSNRPPEPGKLYFRPGEEGKILTMESDAILPNRGPKPTHIVRQFAPPGAVPY